MTILEVQPLVLKDVEASFGDDDFRKHLDAVTLTPTSSQTTWSGLGRNTHTDANTATWTCVMSGAQDWDSTQSLSRFLFDHEGETVDFTFRPRSGVGPSFMVQVVITPGAIGGSVNAYAPLSVTLGVNGKPLLVEADPVVPAP